MFQADEPSQNGGKDAGPDPHELLLAALGACAGITVQMYADQKQWPLAGSTCRLVIRKSSRRGWRRELDRSNRTPHLVPVRDSGGFVKRGPPPGTRANVVEDYRKAVYAKSAF